MLFNSFTFLVFFTIFFFLYWFVTGKNLRWQNIVTLVASYIFYSWWDWRFLFLLILSTLIDYVFGLLIHRTTDKKKLYLWLSIFNNLIILGFFKYYNFFADSFKDALQSLGIETHPYVLSIVLPVGISFYTFHGMSYVIDIYHGKAKPITNFIDYALFVCFFPLLVAGPIERANHLLPQVVRPRIFNYAQAVAGMRLLLWGLFKKVVIADNIAPKVDYIFQNYEHLSSLTLITGAIYFAFQIYCDFSGYSDMALGIAKLLGFELLINFRFPYFSRDIAEFWRRWHISLSSWFRDYLYIPLGGSKKGMPRSILNTFVIFIVSGFWHGANWTFLVWGFLHALYFIPLLVLNKNRTHKDVIAEDRALPSIVEGGQMLITFALVTIAWIFFRAESIGHALDYLARIFSSDLRLETKMYPYYIPLGILLMLVVEWMSRRNDVAFFFDTIRSRIVRYAVYFILLIIVMMYGSFSDTAFIYFQF
jgi:alginate O-acetyltransferase complex protein AlgI